MLIQIAILAWVFLGERLNGKQILGLLLAGIGALVVQLGKQRLPNQRQLGGQLGHRLGAQQQFPQQE